MKNVFLMMTLVSGLALANISSVSYLPSEKKVSMETSLGFGDLSPRSSSSYSSSSYSLGLDLAYGVMKNHTVGGTIAYRSTDTTVSIDNSSASSFGISPDSSDDGFSNIDLSWNYRFLSSFSRQLDFKTNFSIVSDSPTMSAINNDMKNIGFNSTYTARFSENFEGFVNAGVGYYFGGDKFVSDVTTTGFGGSTSTNTLEVGGADGFISERIRGGARFHATSQFFVGGNMNLDSYQGFFSDPVFTLGINSGYKINPTSRVMAMASRSSFSDSDTVGWNLDLNYNMEI